jgi:hypothetical protein
MDIELIDDNGLLFAEFSDADDDTAGIGEGVLNGETHLFIGCYPVPVIWLDQEMCAAIWPLIKRFAETGTLKEIADE